jgi:alpha-beta hydrolase superfamily lysophospholipase
VLRGKGLLTPIQRGHGPAHSVMLQDIDQLLVEAATRYPERPRFLYGHSLGGGLVLLRSGTAYTTRSTTSRRSKRSWST